jgi:hypothetical protein
MKTVILFILNTLIAVTGKYEGWNFNNGNTAVETPCNGTK